MTTPRIVRAGALEAHQVGDFADQMAIKLEIVPYEPERRHEREEWMVLLDWRQALHMAEKLEALASALRDRIDH
jgi:hypothetical protein